MNEKKCKIVYGTLAQGAGKAVRELKEKPVKLPDSGWEASVSPTREFRGTEVTNPDTDLVKSIF